MRDERWSQSKSETTDLFEFFQSSEKNGWEKLGKTHSARGGILYHVLTDPFSILAGQVMIN